MTTFIILMIGLAHDFAQEVTVDQKLWKNIVYINLPTTQLVIRLFWI